MWTQQEPGSMINIILHIASLFLILSLCCPYSPVSWSADVSNVFIIVYNGSLWKSRSRPSHLYHKQNKNILRGIQVCFIRKINCLKEAVGTWWLVYSMMYNFGHDWVFHQLEDHDEGRPPLSPFLGVYVILIIEIRTWDCLSVYIILWARVLKK